MPCSVHMHTRVKYIIYAQNHPPCQLASYRTTILTYSHRHTGTQASTGRHTFQSPRCRLTHACHAATSPFVCTCTPVATSKLQWLRHSSTHALYCVQSATVCGWTVFWRELDAAMHACVRSRLLGDIWTEACMCVYVCVCSRARTHA
jgi:hypothetical protein